MIQFNKEGLIRLIKFGSIGGFITIFGIIGYYICLEIYNFSIYPTFIVLNIIAVIFSYLLNTKFTFRKKRNLHDSIRYYIIYLTGIAIGLGLIYLIENNTSLKPFFIVLLIIPIRVFITYLMVSKFVFSKSKLN